jgi:hypothetical protein
MLRGFERVGAQFTLTMAAYNLARLPKLLAAGTARRPPRPAPAPPRPDATGNEVGHSPFFSDLLGGP